MKFFFFLFLFSFCANALTLPEKIYQGDLVYGTLETDEYLFMDEKELPRQKNIFLFAVGRNAPETLRLTLKKKELVKPIILKILPYEWKLDRVDGVPQKTVTPSKWEQKRIAREQKKINAARTDKSFQGFPVCFLKPFEGRYSGLFGEQRIYNGIPKSPHSGLDIAAPNGTPVPATADGVVTLAEKDLFYTGGTVIVHHGSGIYSSYCHLSKLNASVGDKIKQGEIIGFVGATGRATGPHLHLTLSWENTRFDPARVLKEVCP